MGRGRTAGVLNLFNQVAVTIVSVFSPHIAAAAAAVVVVGCLRQRPHSSADRDLKPPRFCFQSVSSTFNWQDAGGGKVTHRQADSLGGLSGH